MRNVYLPCNHYKYCMWSVNAIVKQKDPAGISFIEKERKKKDEAYLNPP